jgi:predicted DNA-binding transcriptional regulator AlpA
MGTLAQAPVSAARAAIENAISISRDLSTDELPVLLGSLEEAKQRLELRVHQAAAGPTTAGNRLLTVQEVAEALQVSEQQVYRWAKTLLKPAAVDLGPGTLRFEPTRVRRIIESRRR